LSATTLNAQDLLDLLNQDPLLDEAYRMSAGVGEGYTVLEHTKMVLQQALEHQHHFEEKIKTHLPWNYFLLFLALHDIGKGVALKESTNSNQTKISKKASELEKTRQIIHNFLTTHQIDLITFAK
jgi:hypothetical protein